MNYCKYIFLFAFLIAGLIGEAQSYKFDFGNGKIAKGYTQVSPSTRYSPELGYGFEFSAGLKTHTVVGKDDLKGDYITSDKPFYFSVKLPEGNYNVKVLLGDSRGTSTTTIKAECRRLMIEKAETKKREIHHAAIYSSCAG